MKLQIVYNIDERDIESVEKALEDGDYTWIQEILGDNSRNIENVKIVDKIC